MKTKFSVHQISDFAKKVRTYKKLFITTQGQMFRTKIDAEAAVRTLNMIIDDTNEHVGILPVDKDMLSVEKLRLYGQNPAIFDKLFEDAKIPVSKGAKKPEHKRASEEPSKDKKAIVDEVENALGTKKKVDPPKVDPPSKK